LLGDTVSFDELQEVARRSRDALQDGYDQENERWTDEYSAKKPKI
jgi:hypothetical protein